MFRRILSLFVALGIAAPPAASADPGLYFRYRMPVNTTPAPPEVDYSVGNDIQAWFVSPVGHEFLKEIPVATRDVAAWKKGSGSLPEGITISDEGLVSGVAEKVEKADSLWYGSDAGGSRIARADIRFSTFEPVGSVTRLDWYTHTGEYFYKQIPAPEGINVVRWDLVSGDAPEGMAIRNGAFDGRPAKAGSYWLALRGFDYLDREVAFTWGEFLVQDGPVVEHIDDILADIQLGERFAVVPQVRHSIGTLSYALKPVEVRPSGLDFDALSGKIEGVYRTFDTSAAFVIEARDSGSGRIGRSNEFTLATAPEAIDLSNAKDLIGYVGTPFQHRIARTSTNVRFTVTEGSLPEGLRIDEESGSIVGTPKEIGTESGIVITATGVGVTESSSRPFSFRILSQPIRVSTEPVHVRIATPFTSAEPVVHEGVDPPYAFSASPTADDDLLFDVQTGQFHSSGLASAGVYDQIIGVSNESGWGALVGQIIRAYNPISLSYSPSEAKRLSPVSIEPLLPPDSVMPSSTFDVTTGSLPDFLHIDRRTGVIWGTPTKMEEIGEYGPFVVTHTDATGDAPISSNEFMIKVEDRPALEVVQLTSDVARWVGNHPLAFAAENVYNGVWFSLADRGNLPDTLGINQSGLIRGTTTDPIGTVYSFTVHAVDGVGYTADLPATLTVVEPKNIAAVSGNLEPTYTWTVGREFIDLTMPRVTNTYGEVTYAFDGDSRGLSIDQDTLAIRGHVTEVGSFTVPFTITDETDRAPVRGIATFVIQPEMSVSASAVDIPRGAQLSYAPQRSYGIAPFKWSIESGILPGTLSFPAMSFDQNTGTISGKPRVEMTYPLTLKVIDATGQEERVSFDIVVGKPLPFSFHFGEGWMTLGNTSGASPEFENRSEEVVWEHVSGYIPDGISFFEDGYYEGKFYGRPREDGLFENILIKGTDTGTGETYTANVTLKVTRNYEIGYGPASFRHRAGSRPGKFEYTASNVTLPVRYEIVNNPYPSNVSVDADTGEISVTFPSPGKFTVPFKVTDLFDRTRTSNLTFDIVGDLSVSAPESMLFKRYSAGYQPITVKNLIGTASYVAQLPAGLSASNGAISGTPEVTADIDAMTVTVTDGYDGSSATSNAFALKVEERDALELEVADHATNQYRPVLITPVLRNPVGQATFTIEPELPEGLSFNPANGHISGTSDDVFTGAFTVTATDTKGGELGTATSSFTLEIDERLKPDVQNGGTITALLNHGYRHTLHPKDVYGTVSWEHVSGDLPEGIVFDPEAHAFVGVPTEYGLKQNIVIRITDVHDGVSTVADRVISVDVKQDGSPIDFIFPEEVAFRAGQNSGSPRPAASNTVGDVEWSVSGLEGTGLVIDPVTGEISGAASAPVDLVVALTARDITGRERGRTVRVVVKPDIAVEFEKSSQLVFNYSFDKQAENGTGGDQPTARNTYGDVEWSLSPAGGLPAGLTFNGSTGRFEGKPLQLGSFGPFTLTAKDSLPGAGTLTGVMLEVAMNDDPIELSVSPYVTKIGFPIRTPAAVYDNALGRARFFPENNDLAGTNLVLDEDTGVLRGSFQTVQDRNINIAVTDEYTTRVTSKPLRLQVLPHLVLTGPVTAILEAQTEIQPVAITPTNVAGVLEWEPLDPAQEDLLPPGITFDTATGSFKGYTDYIGTYGPFTVHATDRFSGGNDRGQSNPVVLEVKPGSRYMNLKPTALPEAQRRMDYEFDFLTVLDLVGIPESQVNWVWGSVEAGEPALPTGMSIVNGKLTGIPTTTGTYRFNVQASGMGKSTTRAYELTVSLPETSMSLEGGVFNVKQYDTQEQDLASRLATENIPASEVKWKISGGDAEALQWAALQGTTLTMRPLKSGTWTVSVTATFDDGVEHVSATADYQFDVEKSEGAGAHRYWRFYAETTGEGNGSPGNYNSSLNLAEIEFRVNGTDVNSLATFTASCCYAGGYPIAAALDKNWGSFWHGTGYTPEERMFTADFGNNPQAIDSLYLVRRHPTYNQAPILFEVLWSDDGVNWTTAWTDEHRHWSPRDYLSVYAK